VLPDAEIRRVVRAYDARVAQLHVLGRVLTCPLHPVLAQLPASGSVLDVGCGHGLFTLLAATASPDRQLVGVDIDADKIALARRAADRLDLSGRVQFRVSEDGSLPAGPFDAVMCVDVLYLLGPERGAALLTAMAGAVRPGGTVVVKEMSDQPAWKARWNHLQEVGATRVFGYTEGDQLEVLTPGQIVRPLQEAGLVVTEQPVDRWYPHPHLLVVARA